MSNAMNSWREQGLPAVYWHTTVPFLMKCPGFYSAKCGNIHSARAVVGSCINRRYADELRQKYKGAVLLPIMTNNKLPIALAQAIGLEVSTSATMRRDTMQSKQLNDIERILCLPEFARVAPQRYILVDDIIGQKSAVYSLQKHVANCGGVVEAAVALACSFGGEARMAKIEGECIIAYRYPEHIAPDTRAI